MIERLLDLVGNTYLYQNKEFKIEKVKRINSSYVIITNKKIFNFYEAEAFKFVNELKQTTNELVSKENKSITKNISKQEPKQINTLKKTNEMNSNEDNELIKNDSQQSVKEVLLDALLKVKNDKQYIPQANAICNIASQLINIQKLELQILSKSKSEKK